MKKQTVLFLITKSNWGGAQRYVFDVASSLDTNRYTPIVAVGGDGPLTTKLAEAGIRTITIESLTRDISLRQELRATAELFQLLRKEQPDILHVNSSKAGGIGCFLGRLTRVPRIIFTAHGWAFNEDRPGWQKVLIRALHWSTVLLSHQTIAVSAALKQQLTWPGAQQKMTVITPGRAVPRFLDSTLARQALCDTVPALIPYLDDPWLICIAELHPVKQHVTLLTAMTEIVKNTPQTRLILIGGGELRGTIERGIADRGLKEHVFLTGALPEAARYLPAATIFVLASRSEAYGYVLHEAGLAERPIVATNVGGVPDVVEDGVTGTLVAPGHPAWFAEAVQHYLTHPSIATAHGQAARKKLAPRTLAAMAAATAAVYDTSTPSVSTTD